MADEDLSPKPTDESPNPEPSVSDKSSSESSSESSDSSDSDSESDSEKDPTVPYVRRGDVLGDEDIPEDDNSPEANLKRFSRILDSRRYRKEQEEEEREYVFHEDLFDFPHDPENWTEADLKEYWADAPIQMTKPGWDPNWVSDDEVDIINDEIQAGRDPPIAPFYVPYRKPYPVIPDNNYDISSAKAVIEELDRIEEFLTWHSFVFEDGSTYEGTVWDDLAHGKGVYVAEQGLVRYEGEWLQNSPEGHGVLEVDLPDYEPVPGSKMEAKMRAEGRIFSRDFMTPEDREWLEKDIEDSIRFSRGQREIPFYENEEWVRQFGEKPEKGRYRYAGQWKHGRMHGCGVYELNERTIYGRFYFGELLEKDHGCDVNICALHSSIAEVASAKARMFTNKPDGMVREEKGPYNDPQHPYLYEEDDVWMAPGFINQFYEVPDYWKVYVEDVDEERQMWINSFYKAPLRLPMPAELEYWWSTDETPEFVLINKEPEPDPKDPSKLIRTEDPLILHTPTGRIINYIDDEEYGIRLFWQPPLEDGEDVDPSKAEFLPLGFDEFYGRGVSVKKGNILERAVTAVENKCKPLFDKLEKWTEEKKKDSEMRMKLMEQELELLEAEKELKEAIKDMEDTLKTLEKEEEKKMEEGSQEPEDTLSSEPTDQFYKTPLDEDENEDEDEDEEEEDDITPPPSFGSVIDDQTPRKEDSQKGKGAGRSPFAVSSLSFASFGLASVVPSQLQQSFIAWNESKLQPKTCLPSSPFHFSPVAPYQQPSTCSVRFPRVVDQNLSLRAAKQRHHQGKHITLSRPRSHPKPKVCPKLQRNRGEKKPGSWICPRTDPRYEVNILSLHTLV